MSIDEKANAERPKKTQGWGRLFGRGRVAPGSTSPSTSTSGEADMKRRPEKWSMGVLNDKETEEVPGEQCLLVKRIRACMSQGASFESEMRED